MSSYAISINTAEFTAALVSFPPFRWHRSLCFLVIDLAFSFILLQVTHIILIRLIRIRVENYSKIQKVVV